jgi:predicted NodU family carbamoyl transferase
MEKEKPVYVLGTGLSHDGSACLLKDGKISVAIEKERITRSKHDGYNDDAAIKYCLETQGIGIEDVDLIVQTGNYSLFLDDEYAVQEWKYGNRIVKSPHHNVPVVTLSHHLAHAYNAIGTAPFEDMAVLVIDGSGQAFKNCMDLDGINTHLQIPSDISHLYLETDSFYHYRDNKLTTLRKEFSCFSEFQFSEGLLPMCPIRLKHSMGDMYEQASAYCLGKGSFNAGKLMGLAPYGKPGVYTHEIFECKDGRVSVRYEWQRIFNKPVGSYPEFKKNFQYYADIAYWVQKETERAILYIVKERSTLSDAVNLAYTGGVALNAVANAKILNSGIFSNLYMTPAAGDNGLSIGCAYYGWLEVLKQQRVMHDQNSCFGKIYTNTTLHKAIADFKLVSEHNTNQVVDTFFDILSEGVPVFATTGSTFTIQFIVRDCGMYMLQIRDGVCKTISEITGHPDATVMIEGALFIRLMLDFQTVSNTLREGEVLWQGDVRQIAVFADAETTRSKMQEAIFKSGGSFKKSLFKEEDDIISAVATLLSQGKVIGWFQGASEFGPRALGHRSIIADPRRKDIQHHINANIKFREDFRPFAPSVLLEDVSKYFQYEGVSPYMIMVAQVQPEWKDMIPGVVHKDNSCRIQTVTPDWNERYFRLLHKFRELTGIGVLLNTSFNRRNMPIVETPEQALNFFYECDLDYLVMDNFIVYKEHEDEFHKTLKKSNSTLLA